MPPTSLLRGPLIRSAAASTVCEWKGPASYWDVVVPGHTRIEGAVWSYEHPTRPFRSIAGYLAFLPAAFECEVDGERVRPQEGGFYGGWITADVVGPFKGGAGSWGW